MEPNRGKNSTEKSQTVLIPGFLNLHLVISMIAQNQMIVEPKTSMINKA